MSQDKQYSQIGHLKSLNTKISNKEVELKAIQEQIKNLEASRNGIQKEVAKLKDQRTRIEAQNQGVTLSEHALLRFLERVEGIDLVAVSQKILPESVIKTVEQLGDGRYPVGSPVQYYLVIKNNKVVTVEV